MSALLERAAVRRVRAALVEAGVDAEVVVLAETARTAAEAAASLGVPQGAIVKSLVFLAGERPVMALVSGDRRCDTAALARALGIEAPIGRADADTVRAATGFTIGGVAPVGLASPLPRAIDAGLFRFARVYAAAGHPHCVFGIAPDALARIAHCVRAEGLGIVS